MKWLKKITIQYKFRINLKFDAFMFLGSLNTNFQFFNNNNFHRYSQKRKINVSKGLQYFCKRQFVMLQHLTRTKRPTGQTPNSLSVLIFLCNQPLVQQSTQNIQFYHYLFVSTIIRANNIQIDCCAILLMFLPL